MTDLEKLVVDLAESRAEVDRLYAEKMRLYDTYDDAFRRYCKIREKIEKIGTKESKT